MKSSPPTFMVGIATADHGQRVLSAVGLRGHRESRPNLEWISYLKRLHWTAWGSLEPLGAIRADELGGQRSNPNWHLFIRG